MKISASQVKELRERTGAGMMECKKALTEADGNLEVAIEIMRKAGQARADKKASRIAAEGLIETALSNDLKSAAVVEVNCETDFVAKDDSFRAFVKDIVRLILEVKPRTFEELQALSLNNQGRETVELARKALMNKIGENIQIRRYKVMTASTGKIAQYLHFNKRIGVLVNIERGDQVLGRDIAMHIATSRPVAVKEQDVPKTLLDKEKEIYTAQAEASGKPADIVRKMVDGRLKKYLGEVTLLGQPFVKDPDKTVAKHLKESEAEILDFIRYEVGEGIEKRAENFAQEVMMQVKEREVN